jgi:hypothetical protein
MGNSIMAGLWNSQNSASWTAALERYEAVIEAQGVGSLPEHDRWYRVELPSAMLAREQPFVTHSELVRVTRWKMSRGAWRARNLSLVQGNAPELVEKTSREALGRIPEPTAPISILSKLAGVGPATASAIVAAAAPGQYPFLDELVAAQVPGLGPPAFTLRYYAQYAEALRQRAAQLGTDWSPADVERALWASAGGKAGAA